MRRISLLGPFLCGLYGCASPREKDCKVLLPLVDETKAAREMFVPGGGLKESRFADRPRGTVGALRGVSPSDPPVKEAAGTLAEAMTRYTNAMTAVDQLVTALRIKREEAPALRLGLLDASKPHVERLLHRCGIAQRTEPQRALADCAALERALERCVAPSADDTTAEEQLLTCAAAVERVRSPDPAAEASVRQIAATIREFEPFARAINVSAREAIRVAKQLSPSINEQTAARADAEKAEQAIRGLCATVPSGDKPR